MNARNVKGPDEFFIEKTRCTPFQTTLDNFTLNGNKNVV